MDVKVVTRWGWSLWSKKTTKSPYCGPRASKWKTDSTLLDSILKVEANKLLSNFHLEALGPRYVFYSIQMVWIIYWYIWKEFCLSLECKVQIFKGASYTVFWCKDRNSSSSSSSSSSSTESRGPLDQHILYSIPTGP